MPLSWTSDPLPVGVKIVSRFYLEDDDGEPYEADDFESWILRVVQGSEVVYQSTGPEDIDDIIEDPPIEWDEGSYGAQFNHELIYSQSFQPVAGEPVTIQFWFKLAAGGYELVEHTVPLTKPKGPASTVDEVIAMLG